jgi:hypothetical protein
LWNDSTMERKRPIFFATSSMDGLRPCPRQCRPFAHQSASRWSPIQYHHQSVPQREPHPLRCGRTVIKRSLHTRPIVCMLISGLSL